MLLQSLYSAPGPPPSLAHPDGRSQCPPLLLPGYLALPSPSLPLQCLGHELSVFLFVVLDATLGLKGRDRAMSPATCLMEMSPRPYLDASTFGDHDLPHAVEAVEVGLREARGQDGAPALREVASTWHWEEATLVRGLSLRVSQGNLPRASQPACELSPWWLLK